MKCPTCESCEYAQYCGATEIMRKCDRHNKKVDMTNEEWFASLSTKEKAKWMFRLTYKCYWCGREYDKTKKHNEKECPFHKCLDDSKGFEKWLKKPHREG